MVYGKCLPLDPQGHEAGSLTEQRRFGFDLLIFYNRRAYMEEDRVFEERGYKKYPREPHDYPEIVHMYYKRFKGNHCIKYFIAAHLWELSTDKMVIPCACMSTRCILISWVSTARFGCFSMQDGLLMMLRSTAIKCITADCLNRMRNAEWRPYMYPDRWEETKCKI